MKTKEEALEFVKKAGYPCSEDSPYCAVVALRHEAVILPEYGCDGSVRDESEWAYFDMAGKIDTGMYGDVYYF